MLANTLTLTINSVAKTLLRSNQDNFGSVYQLKSPTERITLRIRHSEQTVKGAVFDQHNAVVEWVKIPTAPAVPLTLTASITLRGQFGTDPADLDNLSDALGVLFAANLATIVQGDN
jgi:hypothetical protein